MNKVAMIAAVLAAGAAGAALVYVPTSTRPLLGALTTGVEQPAQGAATAASIDVSRMYDSLAAILEQEVAERQRLEEQVADLGALVERLQSQLERQSLAVAAAPPPEEAPRRRPPRRWGGEGIWRIDGLEEQLAAEGLTEERAAYLARRRDELTMQRMYLRERAAREGWLDSPRFTEEWLAAQDRPVLEGELSPFELDAYLRATGQANSVRVANVLQTSPAERAGLQAGDVLVSYDGQPVYSGGQLRAASRSGASGEPVIVEVERGGQRVQLTIPRGPLGVNLSVEPDD